MENQIKNTPENWKLYYNDDGVPYWHDHISGESVWANQSSEEDLNNKNYETSNISATNYYINNNSNNNNKDNENNSEEEEDDDDDDIDENFENSFKAFLSTSEGREAMENELSRLEKEFGNRMKKSISKITRNQLNIINNDNNDLEFGNNNINKNNNDNDDDNDDDDDDENYSDDSISTEDSDVQEILEPLMVVPKWMPYYPTMMKKINAYTTHFTMINGAREVLSSSSNVTTTELVVNTSVACVSTSSRVINGTKYLVSRFMTSLFSLLGTFFSLIWSKIDNIIKTYVLRIDKKKKSKKYRNKNNDDI